MIKKGIIMDYWNRLLNVIIIVLSIVIIIFAIKVIIDIGGTGVIMEETSPDGKYEVIVRREKYPMISKASTIISSIDLYNKEAESLILSMEVENYSYFAELPEIRPMWLKEGLYLEIYGNPWYRERVCYVLPYNK